jgi:hypothetical protein
MKNHQGSNGTHWTHQILALTNLPPPPPGSRVLGKVMALRKQKEMGDEDPSLTLGETAEYFAA